jgi:hypothetical protein
MMTRSLLGAASTLMLLALGNTSATATPSFTLDPSQSRVLRLANLYPDADCHPARLDGRVVARRLDGGGTQLVGVTLEERSGRRTALNVHVETSALGYYQIGWIAEGLQSLLR